MIGLGLAMDHSRVRGPQCDQRVLEGIPSRGLISRRPGAEVLAAQYMCQHGGQTDEHLAR